ncbi:HU family DNA-binding protein [Streptosporangium sp. V21-05]|uniref:HU family DNA-binding protein n=1 Tax=Streptosporangium sp. V21-05 TaxID=3446115 RepID=UPI003F531C76
MNKTELIAAIAEHADLPKTTVAKVLDAALDVIPLAVAAGEKVTLPGFGVFDAAERAARTAKNPATGQPVQVPAKQAPRFKAGAAFKDLVKQSKSPALSS